MINHDIYYKVEFLENSLANKKEEIPIYNQEGIEAIRKACIVSAKILQEVGKIIKPGISTEEIDVFCSHYAAKYHAKPAALNYKGFPKSVCTSVNEVACHGIPSSQKILKDGDIINVDCAVILDGWYGDASCMYSVGKGTIRGLRICEAAKSCMLAGINSIGPKVQLGNVGANIQKEAKKLGYSIVKEYCGHGVGRKFHDAPHVLSFGIPGTGIELIPGMIFTVEPIINEGAPKVSVCSDGWTVRTSDNSLSAQWEHTVLVTNNGCEILTIVES